MLSESVSDIIGQRVDSSISKEIKKTVASFDEVQGAYDLLLHSYGPDMLIGSVHIEVADTMTAGELDRLQRDIADKVLREHNVIMAGISVYSINTRDDKAAEIYEDIRRMVMSEESILQMHGFFYDEASKIIRFDIIIDFAASDGRAIYERVCSQVRSKYPEYSVDIVLDRDVSD